MCFYMRSDKKMYHALFPRVGVYIGERGHGGRLILTKHSSQGKARAVLTAYFFPKRSISLGRYFYYGQLIG